MSIIILLILTSTLIGDIPPYMQYECGSAALLQMFADILGLNMVMVLQVILMIYAAPIKYHSNMLIKLLTLVIVAFIFSVILVGMPFFIDDEPYGKGEDMVRCYLKNRKIKLWVYDIFIWTYTGTALFVYFLIKKRLRTINNNEDIHNILRRWLFIPLFIFTFSFCFFVHDGAEQWTGYVPTWDAINIAIGNLWGVSWAVIYIFTLYRGKSLINNEESSTNKSSTNNTSDQTFPHSHKDSDEHMILIDINVEKMNKVAESSSRGQCCKMFKCNIC
eukprot:137653_1